MIRSLSEPEYVWGTARSLEPLRARAGPFCARTGGRLFDCPLLEVYRLLPAARHKTALGGPASAASSRAIRLPGFPIWLYVRVTCRRCGGGISPDRRLHLAAEQTPGAGQIAASTPRHELLAYDSARFVKGPPSFAVSVPILPVHRQPHSSCCQHESRPVERLPAVAQGDRCETPFDLTGGVV
jgi:hypothetical protein